MSSLSPLGGEDSAIQRCMFHRFTTNSISMKRMVGRMALLFNIGRQWLTAAPRYRGAVICGVSAIGAMIAIGYNGDKGISPRSAPVVQTSDVAPTQDSAKSKELFATRNPVNNHSQSGKEGPLPTALALDKSFLVGDSENENVAIRDKDEVKKTAKSSVKKPQRRVTNRDRDRGFSPLREIQRAPEKIWRVIRRIL